MKRGQQIVLGILIVALGVIIAWRATYEKPETTNLALTISEDCIPSEIFQALNSTETNDKAELQKLINRDTEYINYLNSLIRFDDWTGKNQVYKNLIGQLTDNIEKYENQIFLIEEAEEEAWRRAIENSPSIEMCQQDHYLAATYIWNYFKYYGYSDYMIAGIMGNIMCEVGGGTLYIQWWLYGACYYGMCQWNNVYSAVWGTDLKTQCDFLRDTIEYEINTFGFVYRSGFKYKDFCQLQDAGAAARAFAASYERCASGSYGIRQNNAITAYNYFVN